MINTLQDHTELHKLRNYRSAGSQTALQQTTTVMAIWL